MGRSGRRFAVIAGWAAGVAMFAVSAGQSAAVSGVKRVVERVNLSSGGAQATDGGPTTNPMAFSTDGRFVAFASVTQDTNGLSDYFVASVAIVPGTRIAIFRPATREWFARDDDGSTSSVQFGGPGDQPVPADYLGLGKLQQAVFRPSTREWFINNPDTGGTVVVQYGGPGDMPVPGDYFGIGRASIAIFRPSTGEWYLRHDNGQTTRIPFGAAGDMPVPGDYLERGRDQLAVFRPSTREWLIREHNFSTLRISYGGPGDQPIPVPFRARF